MVGRGVVPAKAGTQGHEERILVGASRGVTDHILVSSRSSRLSGPARSGDRPEQRESELRATKGLLDRHSRTFVHLSISF